MRYEKTRTFRLCPWRVERKVFDDDVAFMDNFAECLTHDCPCYIVDEENGRWQAWCVRENRVYLLGEVVNGRLIERRRWGRDSVKGTIE